MPQKKQRAGNGSGRRAVKAANGQSDDRIRDVERAAKFDERRTDERQAAYDPADEEAVRTRAYYLFLERGGRAGHELDDWLRAEHEIHS